MYSGSWCGGKAPGFVGYDWADRFPAIVEAAMGLKGQSFLIDGEAIVCRPDGLSDFDALATLKENF